MNLKLISKSYFYGQLQICRDIRSAKTVKLDRWSIDIIHKRQLGIRAKNKRFSMVNYVSVGVDACVTYG